MRQLIIIVTVFLPTILFGQIKNSAKSDSLFFTLFELTTSKFGKLNLMEVIEFEKNTNSKEITPEHFMALGKGIYPNNKHFKLKTPKTFSRIEDSTITNQTEYFYTRKKSIIRVVMFEWNETIIYQDDLLLKISYDSTKIDLFQDKFNMIRLFISNRLGNPISVNIESDYEKTFRDDVKWESLTGVKAYLFMFGNESGYRQIRLAVYKE